MRIHVRNHGTQLTVAVPYLRTVFQPFGQVQVGANPPGQLMGFACLDHDKIVVEHILSQRLEEMSLFASKPAGVGPMAADTLSRSKISLVLSSMAPIRRASIMMASSEPACDTFAAKAMDAQNAKAMAQTVR